MRTLSEHLAIRSKEICLDNGCHANDGHKCESYAYISKDMRLLDICASDYFIGCSAPHACIPLPWNGTQEELEKEVADQCAEQEAE